MGLDRFGGSVVDDRQFFLNFYAALPLWHNGTAVAFVAWQMCTYKPEYRQTVSDNRQFYVVAPATRRMIGNLSR